MSPKFSLYDCLEMRKASQELYNEGLMPADEVSYFKELLLNRYV